LFARYAPYLDASWGRRGGAVRLSYAATFIMWLALVGADCRKPQMECLDFSGEEIQFTVADPDACFAAASDCMGFDIPSSFRVRVSDVPAQMRQLVCDVPRADIVGSFSGDLVLDGPVVASPQSWVTGGSRFAVVENVVIQGTECSGVLYANFSTLPSTSDRTDIDYWLTLDGSESSVWDFNYGFVPDDPARCTLDTSECGVANCVVRAERAE